MNYPSHELSLCEIPPNLIPDDYLKFTSSKNGNIVSQMLKFTYEKRDKVSSLNQFSRFVVSQMFLVKGNKILPICTTSNEVEQVLCKLSGTNHTINKWVIYTDKEKGVTSKKLFTTRVKFRNLDLPEIKEYALNNDWVGTCGYNFREIGQKFIAKSIGHLPSLY